MEFIVYIFIALLVLNTAIQAIKNSDKGIPPTTILILIILIVLLFLF